MRDLDPILTEHAYDLRSRRKAERSITNRRHNVMLFAEWLDAEHGNMTVADVKPSHITRWLTARVEAGDAPETVLTRFGHLRAFYRWCVRDEIVERSPLQNLSEPTTETQPVPVLGDDQLRALFATCRGKTFIDRRDFAMMVFLTDTGVRVGELVGLELNDLDFASSTAMVTGKFGRNRVVAFGPKTGKAVLTYLRARSVHKDADSPRVWIGQRGPLNEAAVWKIVKMRGEDAGIKGLHPHVLRHTFAHRFRMRRGAPDDLAQLGGWRSQAMLARYGASAAVERAVEAHRHVDPLGDVL